MKILKILKKLSKDFSFKKILLKIWINFAESYFEIFSKVPYIFHTQILIRIFFGIA